MTLQVVLDTVILAALLDTQNKWHASAVAIRDALKTANAAVFYFDCVINEVVSVLARRLAEQRRSDQFDAVFDSLEQLTPPNLITWVSRDTQRLYSQVMALVRQHAGELNFHDALIALTCRELGIKYVASFDRDFGRVDWLTRLENPNDVPSIEREV